MTNAARQAKFKARQRSLGLRQISVWVSAEQAATIKAYLAGALRSPEKATAATVSAGASPARASVTGNAAASTASAGEAVVRTRPGRASPRRRRC